MAHAVLIAGVLAAALSPGPLPRVVVTADARRPDEAAFPSATTVLDEAALRRPGAREDVADALRGIAGVAVRDRRNHAQDLQLSVRGFGARGSFGVRGLKLYVGGVPATAADGQGQLSHALLDRATRIEVERGPVAALYGNAAGAVVRIEVDPGAWPHRYGLHAAANSDLWRASATAAAHGDRASALAVVSHFEADGFRPHAAARRDQLDAVASGRIGELEWRASANALDQPEAEDPLGLSRAAFDADPDATAPQALAFDTRKAVAQRQAGFALARRADGWDWTLGAYGGARDVEQYLAIPPGPQRSPTHAGGVIDLERRYGGIDARASRRFRVAGMAATATLGAHVERLDERRRGHENFVGDTLGVRGALRRDEDNDTDAADAYARLDLELSPRWQALAGVRRSALEFRSADRYVRAGNPDDSGARDFADTGAVAGLAFAPDPRTRWHFSWGEGFESPTANELAYRSDGASGLNATLGPSRNRQRELGVSHERDGVRLALHAFEIETDDEIVTATNQGGRATFRNAGSTRRHGVEAELDATLGSLELRAAATWLDARFEDSFAAPAGVVPAGSRIPGVPRAQGWLELRRRTTGTLTLGAVAEYTGSVVVDDLARDRAGAAATLDLYVTRSWRAGVAAIEGSLRLANVADRRYAGSVIVNEANARYFEPAPGRTLLATIDVAF